MGLKKAHQDVLVSKAKAKEKGKQILVNELHDTIKGK
jgi:hypothetical protein